MKRLPLLLVLALFTLGLGLRLYDLTDQPIDFHPTRQLRGAIIARGMYYEMLPNADEATRQLAIDFWNSTGQYEPSILERLTALTYLVIGGEYFWVARIYTILFWMVGGMALFALARRMVDKKDPQRVNSVPPATDETGLSKVSAYAALIALAYYLVLPFGVQASRSFQPDPCMVMWMVLFAYTLYRWAEHTEWKWAILSGVFAGLAVVTKAVAAYPVAGVAIAMVLSSFRSTEYKERNILSRTTYNVLRILRNPQIWTMLILMVLPTAVYYISRGGRASEYFSSWTIALAHLLLEPAFYLRWLNLVQNLIGWWALILALAGIILATSRYRTLLLGWWLGYVAYGLVLPYQMYTHSYYHLQLVPLVALSIVPVAQAFLERILKLGKAWQIVGAVLGLVVLAYFSWQALIPFYSRNYRNEPAYWQKIASFLPVDGKIMALTQDYGYRLMYYGWRKVTLWPNRGEQNLSQLRGSEKEFQAFFVKHTANASYFLITSFNQFDDQPDLKQYLYDHYPIIAQAPGYLIFDLKQPK
jgi:4-amino-4-deoxy-L-arabinose transferase-like glycosyltransferase